MNTSYFIASRLKFKGKIAAVSIAVSFLVMIVAVAVSSGFRKEIQDGISLIAGDVQITPADMNYFGEDSPIDLEPAYLPHVENLPQVEAVRPIVCRAGIVKTQDNVHGVLLKGELSSDTLALGVSIPSRLSRLLGLKVGDKMLTYFVGDKVKVRNFTVTSIYQSIIDSDDKLVVKARLSDLQRLNGWDEDEVSAFEILLKDGSRGTDEILAAAHEIGEITYERSLDEEAPVVVTSSPQAYSQLFDWLSLIDFNVLFILILMTVVAGVNMICGLLIMLFENISTIGLMKSLGMTDRSIAKVYLTSSSVVVLKGMILGNLLAFALCAVQYFTHVITLDPTHYFLSHVPIHLDIWKILLADLAAYLVIMVLLLVPSLFISRVDPAKTLSVK